MLYKQHHCSEGAARTRAPIRGSEGAARTRAPIRGSERAARTRAPIRGSEGAAQTSHQTAHQLLLDNRTWEVKANV